MPERPLAPTFRRAFFLAYGLGALLCIVWPLTVQGLLGFLLRPGLLGPSALAEELGFTFTGLVFLSALFVHGRSRRVRAGLAAAPADRRTRVMAKEILLYSAIFELSVFLGLLYYALGGPQAERYARSFIALATVMFLVFVPRLGAWRRASEGEPGLR
jgi:hypothetical protein